MLRLLFAALSIATPQIATAQVPDFIGEYDLAEGPDVGGGLVIQNDGRFRYMLAAGALDERAEGRWERRGDAICLFTEPKPVPPAFTRIAPIAVDGTVPTILVTWPNGRGIAGVDFVLRFDSGDPIDGYTQVDGWAMPEDDPRIPRWIELREPIYHIDAPVIRLDDADRGKLHLRLDPNDIGVVAFDGACLTQSGTTALLRRPEGTMRFRRIPTAK
jgi:hypothetical protein